ncbi:MAG: TIGR03915 family putative DNA repair protein [Lentimicrobiaceae bacterium]|jgi:probable DNA metabolism protein|nr:TIGR03915 family putative DNA repair protein [Lentimicrobiaceae bacterium]
MTFFVYDGTFEGLLCAVFESYSRKIVPDYVIFEKEQLSLFSDDVVSIVSNAEQATRVWKGLQKKLSASACSMLAVTSMASDYPDLGSLLFRYVRKTFDTQKSIETNFGDSDVLVVSKLYKKVSRESNRVIQFVRFQKTVDNIFFAPIDPIHNVLPLVVKHFTNRFADQKWVIYDMRRHYGYYFDLKTTQEIIFENLQADLESGKLSENVLAHDEKLFQQLWKTYFKSMTIKERINPKLHRQNLPKRFWKYLTEKQ